MGAVYADITLTNLFTGKSVNVRAMVDTGATCVIAPASVAEELGFDLEEMSTRNVIFADDRRLRCPFLKAVEVSFQDRSCPVDVAVFGSECLMGIIPLECMGLVVDPIRQCLIPDPKHPNGPELFPGKGGLFALIAGDQAAR